MADREKGKPVGAIIPLFVPPSGLRFSLSIQRCGPTCVIILEFPDVSGVKHLPFYYYYYPPLLSTVLPIYHFCAPIVFNILTAFAIFGAFCDILAYSRAGGFTGCRNRYAVLNSQGVNSVRAIGRPV